MARREVGDGEAHGADAGRGRLQAHAPEQLVVDVVRDEGRGQFAEVGFQRARDGGDVEVGVGDVVVGAEGEAVFDLFDLRGSAGLAVDAFGVHAWRREGVSSLVVGGWWMEGVVGERGTHTSELDFLDTPCDDAGDADAFVLGALFELGAEED